MNATNLDRRLALALGARPQPALRPGAETILAAATVAIVAACAAAAALNAFDGASLSLMTGFASPLVDALAAVLIGLAALRPGERRVRIAWACIALAMLVYAAGDALYAWIDLVQHSDAFPSAADAAYLAFYPIVAAALLLFPAPSLLRREAARLGIDSAIVVLGGGMVVWHVLIHPTLASAGGDSILSLLAFGYPVGDLVLLFAVATIGLRRPAGIAPRALAALVVGLVLMFAADMVYGELALMDVDGGYALDVLYMASSATIALAGAFQVRARPADPRSEPEQLGRGLLLLPYAGLVAGFGVLIASAGHSAGGDVIELVAGAVALTALVLVRQELVLRENSRLMAEQARRDSEARFRSLRTHASDAVLLVDRDGVVAYASPSIERVLGVDDATVLGRPVTRLAHVDDAPRLRQLVDDCAAGRSVAPLEWRLWSRDGVWRQVETIAANLLEDRSVGKIALTTRDVHERKALRQQLQQAAFQDLLTGLPNRALFADRVERAVASGRRSGARTAVLSLDLDGFRRLNDSLGHAVGDVVLRETARRLCGAMRASDTVARLGGDEFGILIDGDAGTASALQVAARIRAALAEPLRVGGTTLQLTASAGVAVSGEGADGSEPTGLIRGADLAMAVSRERGRDGVVLFEASMQEALDGRFELEADLRQALAANQLLLHYQPIVDLATGGLVAAEALVRWEHPTRGRLAPNVFIPLAEEIGVIGEIGTWVLRTACVEAARWARRAPHRVPRVSVNLSAPQLADPQLPWTVQSALAQAGAAPGWLTLEVTESLLIADATAALERLHAIRALGVKISLDDFGTGYSSLAYLQRFPVNHIKIDRSFVVPLDDPETGPGVAEAVIRIAQALGMSTIAEGIETERQLERVRSMGCEFGQGFLLARPLDADAMLQLVGRSSRARRKAA